MATTHSLENLKYYHQQATQFFASELMLLKEAVPKITDERLTKPAMLLFSAGQTGAALLQLANQTDTFADTSVMLARSFMEQLTNFCYVGICDEKEYQAFLLYPIYKQYHKAAFPKMEDDTAEFQENIKARAERQAKLKKIPIVQEALALFSETKGHMKWTKKTMSQRINALQSWGKMMDAFFTISNLEYYSDASEILHGSLYGSTYGIGSFKPGFDPTDHEELKKMTYKNSARMLLQMGMLVHEVFTLIQYTNDIKDIWDHSYRNRGQALNLLLFVIEKKGFEPLLHPSLRKKPDVIIPVHSTGILFEKDRFLLGKYSDVADWAPGFWDGIGGPSLPNEHSIITLQRTILEKTGLQVLNADLLNVAHVFRENNGEVLFKQHLYIVHHFDGNLHQWESAFSELKWFNKEELKNASIVLPAYLHLIDEWLEQRKDNAA